MKDSKRPITINQIIIFYSAIYFSCPDGCSCLGFTVDCSHTTTYNGTSTIYISPSTRMLDVSMRPSVLSHLSLDKQYIQYLVYLNLSACEVRNISADLIGPMRNLLTLDLSFNHLETVGSRIFAQQFRLKSLRLHGNLNLLTIETEAFMGLYSMKDIELKGLLINQVSQSAFASLCLNRLQLSQSVIRNIEEGAFERLDVSKLYMTETKIESFSVDMFKGLEKVNLLFTDYFSICCIKPDFLIEENCFPRSNEFSSCSDLMRNQILRSFIWIVGIFALLGNSLSLLYHLVYDRDKLKLGYGIFVSNLAISDLFMGLYLIIIASADMYYRGEYSLFDESWRNNNLCTFAGILASLSSEQSLLLIGLITLDRLIVVKYPFGDFRIKQKRANILTCIAWIISISISLVPVVFTSHFKHQFYSQSGVCLALPLTKQRVRGWIYSVSVFVGFNFILTILIILGQWLIYREAMASKRALKTKVNSRKNEFKIARNLLLVAVTDLLCWFPVGLLGMCNTWHALCVIISAYYFFFSCS